MRMATEVFYFFWNQTNIAFELIINNAPFWQVSFEKARSSIISFYNNSRVRPPVDWTRDFFLKSFKSKIVRIFWNTRSSKYQFNRFDGCWLWLFLWYTIRWLYLIFLLVDNLFDIDRSFIKVTTAKPSIEWWQTEEQQQQQQQQNRKKLAE